MKAEVQSINLGDEDFEIKISLWDKKANDGEGGYRFGSIVLSKKYNSLVVKVKGDERFNQLVSMKKGIG